MKSNIQQINKKFFFIRSQTHTHKTQIFYLIIGLALFITCSENTTKRADLVNIEKQLSDSLPPDWHLKKDTNAIRSNEIIIESSDINLMPDDDTNASLSPDQPKGKCYIYVLLIPKVSPDSIHSIRKRNKELFSSLPPQDSKNWYNQNREKLEKIDSEPTHYDDKYSYRITWYSLPNDEKDKKEYNQIIGYLNRHFEKYKD